VHVVKIALLYNPKSGAKKGEKLAHQAMKLFHKRGVDVELFPLQRKGHAKDICKVFIIHVYYSPTLLPQIIQTPAWRHVIVQFLVSCCDSLFTPK
jgi:hypothetical protein